MNLENTSHLEVDRFAYSLTDSEGMLSVKKGTDIEEVYERFRQDILHGWTDVPAHYADEIEKYVEPIPELDIVYFEGILTTRAGASATLKQRENELES